jgi:hypothetical protein
MYLGCSASGGAVLEVVLWNIVQLGNSTYLTTKISESEAVYLVTVRESQSLRSIRVFPLALTVKAGKYVLVHESIKEVRSRPLLPQAIPGTLGKCIDV